MRTVCFAGISSRGAAPGEISADSYMRVAQLPVSLQPGTEVQVLFSLKAGDGLNLESNILSIPPQTEAHMRGLKMTSATVLKASQKMKKIMNTMLRREHRELMS